MTPPRIVQIELPPNLDELPAFARGEMMKALEAALFGVLPTPKDPLDERDEAIRAAMNLYEEPKPPLRSKVLSKSRRAKMLAGDWREYLGNAWLREQHLHELSASASTQRRMLHHLSRLNEGCALGWQQLVNIFEGHRHSTF
jgi:hypothetical protein